MEEKKLTPVQQQVVRSIEKAIEKDNQDLEALRIKFEEKLQKLNDQIADLKGVFSADKELLEESIKKSKEALSLFIGPNKKDNNVLQKADIKSETKDCIVCEPENKNAEEFKSDYHKQQVDDLPWAERSTEEIDPQEDDLPFKGIFSKK